MSEQSVEDYDCRRFLVFENFLAFRIGLRISGSSRSSREILFGLSRGESESPLLCLHGMLDTHVVTLRID